MIEMNDIEKKLCLSPITYVISHKFVLQITDLLCTILHYELY